MNKVTLLKDPAKAACCRGTSDHISEYARSISTLHCVWRYANQGSGATEGTNTKKSGGLPQPT